MRSKILRRVYDSKDTNVLSKQHGVSTERSPDGPPRSIDLRHLLRSSPTTIGPVRKVTVAGRRTFTVKDFFGKAFETIALESLLEAALADQMQSDPEIEVFRPQPERFRWQDRDGRRRAYVPDFVVLTSDGGLIFREVKSIGRWHADPTLRHRLATIVRECARLGASFEVWADAGSERSRPEGREFVF